MNRRNFILLTTTGITAIAIPVLYNTYFPTSPEDPELLDELWDEIDVLEIGKTYLSTHPDEQSPEKLRKMLYGNTQFEDHKLAEHISQRIQEDFQKDNILIVAGWVLAQTEARQCALYTLPKS